MRKFDFTCGGVSWGLALLLMGCTAGTASAADLASGTYFVMQTWSQETDFQRPYLVHVPETSPRQGVTSRDANNHKFPVFVFLHGNGGNARGSMTRFVKSHPAMSKTYIMVFAEGYQKSWNIVSERSKADDLDFIESIIQEIATFDNVQADNFSVMGSSNGAALVNQMLIECRLTNIRNYVSAVSPLNTFQYDGENFRAKGPDNRYRNVVQPITGKRILNISGTEDRLVPYRGGPSPMIPANDGKLPFVDAEESIYQWARHMGTGGGKLEVPRREGNLEIFSYLDGDVVHIKAIDRGHNAGGALSEQRLLDFLEDRETADPPKVDVFVSGRDGYHTYRIPSMVVTPKGNLLAICEARRTGSSDHGDVDLVAKRSEDGGKTWSPMQKIAGHHDQLMVTNGNPCTVVDRQTGVIWLALCRDQFEVLVTSSADDGLTWTEPKNITASIKHPEWDWPTSINTSFGKAVVWTGPGIGIQLRNGPHAGRLIIPCHMRPRGKSVSENRMWVFYSDDHGKTWRPSEDSVVVNESQVVELSDGRLLLCGRNQNKKGGRPFHRLVAYSRDGGVTWSESSVDDELMEPVCQASLLSYSWSEDGRPGRLLFSNPSDPDERVRLRVRLSKDDGETWPVSRVVHPERCEYSCLAALPNETVGLLFKGDRRIMYTEFSLAWLAGEGDGN